MPTPKIVKVADIEFRTNAALARAALVRGDDSEFYEISPKLALQILNLTAIELYQLVGTSVSVNEAGVVSKFHRPGEEPAAPLAHIRKLATDAFLSDVLAATDERKTEEARR